MPLLSSMSMIRHEGDERQAHQHQRPNCRPTMQRSQTMSPFHCIQKADRTRVTRPPPSPLSTLNSIFPTSTLVIPVHGTGARNLGDPIDELVRDAVCEHLVLQSGGV
jgi:hypothetical protein